MLVRELHFRGFRGFDKLELVLGKRLTVCVGENGAGKTSILDGLSLLLSQATARLCGASLRAKKLTPTDIRNDDEEARLSISIDEGAGTRNVRWSVVKQGPRQKLRRPLSSELMTLRDYVQMVADRSEGEQYLKGETFVIYYDQNRGAIGKTRQTRTYKSEGRPIEVFEESLSRNGVDLGRLVAWFRDRESLELRRQRRQKSYVDQPLDAVRRAITSATKLSDPYYRMDAPKGLCVTKDGVELHVSQLSTGERTFMAMAGDLARRLAIVNPEVRDPLLGRAIVLIDEIELHLHPRWQRSIIDWFLETFPNCQFVISTHSPQVLGNIHARDIRALVNRHGRVSMEVPNATFGRDSNYILLSVLDGTERQTETSSRLTDLSKAIENSDVATAEEILTELEHSMEGSPPELAIAKARIERSRRSAR